MAIFQIWGDFPVEKLRLKMSSSSCLALGPRALRNVGGISSGPVAPSALIWRMASSSSSFLKATQQLSPANGSFSVDFSYPMQFLSSLLKRKRLPAAYSFMKALALPRLVVKVRPLCSRGSTQAFRGHNYSLSVAIPREQTQSLRHAPHRLLLRHGA